MSKVVWKKGKPKVIWTKEEKKKMWKEAWHSCYKSKAFWLSILLGFCLSFGGGLLIRLYL